MDSKARHLKQLDNSNNELRVEGRSRLRSGLSVGQDLDSARSCPLPLDSAPGSRTLSGVEGCLNHFERSREMETNAASLITFNTHALPMRKIKTVGKRD